MSRTSMPPSCATVSPTRSTRKFSARGSSRRKSVSSSPDDGDLLGQNSQACLVWPASPLTDRFAPLIAQRPKKLLLGPQIIDACADDVVSASDAGIVMA